MDRKAELARKKAKLEEMRKQREDRAAESTSSASPASHATTTQADASSVADLVSSLIGGAPSVPSTPKQVSLSSSVNVASTPTKSLRATRRSKVHLSLSEVRTTSIAPAETVTYTKSIQTESYEEEPSSHKSADAQVEVEAEVKHVVEKEEVHEEAKEPPKPIELSDSQVTQIVGTSDFQEFFDRSSRIIERALNEHYDVAIDYTMSEEDKDEGQTAATTAKVGFEFFDNRFSANRAVTCLDWSPKHPELLVASYNVNLEAPNDPDGMVLVWNTHLPSRAEFIFEHQSAILSTCFARYHPNLIFGGSYSGQIVLWDNRAKRTPVQRSSLSTKAHTHPVYCVDVIGTQNAHNIITVSTDGKLCNWNLDMLKEPIESYDLQCGASKTVAATCIGFPVSDTGSFVAGSEEGAIYPFTRQGGKADFSDPFTGHAGPVTGIDYHKVSGAIDFSQVFLSSSTDWSIKLWVNGKGAKSTRPIYSFEDAGECIYDVKWSTTHPAVFAGVDGIGRVDIWNVNVDTEVPIIRTVVGDGKTALNCLKFNRSGSQIATGSIDGRIFVLDLGERLYTPRADEWNRLKNTLQELQNSATELHTTTSDKLESALQAAALANPAPATTATVSASS